MFHQRDTVVNEGVRIQRSYYADTANHYDEMHLHRDVEHDFALEFLCSILGFHGIGSVLDVGCGTGRALLAIKQKMPHVAVTGIEPSAELRAKGHAKGLADTELNDGDAMNLEFQDGSFDLVCEFGSLHHIPRPSKAVSEMLRVARKAIFISDCNNFGQGRPFWRLTKQLLNAFGLWPVVDLVKTQGKGYTISDGDGLAYSYSVFNDYKQIARACKSVHLLNTLAFNGSPNLYRSASHIALLGLRQ